MICCVLPRPGSDDVVVLKQELINSQTMMDLMMQEREKEKDHLERELKDIKEKYQM